MTKVTLDLDSFKALASETRLDILRSLDGKKLNLNNISKATKLHKVTLHEHLIKLVEAGFVKKKERERCKWVYYKLSWKGESLLHPENTRIVVLFSTTFVILFLGIIGLLNYAREVLAVTQGDVIIDDGGPIKGPLPPGSNGLEPAVTSSGQNPVFLYIALGCLILFIVLAVISFWRYKKNRTPKL